jgi:hypothetical protein
MAGIGGQTESGEIAIMENRPDGRAIGQALFARWLAAGYGPDQS